jgi:hypothetical protein
MRALLAGLVLFAGVAGAAAPVPKADPEVTKAHLDASVNNLKQIVLACHSYHDAFGAFPTNSADKDGKPLLSWRVLILPFLEEEELFKQFKLGEPWDSAANKKLIEKTPKLYAPIRVRGKPGETFYQVFYGEGALFGPKMKPPAIVGITDGTSNTALVVEAGESVIWTKPADLPFDENKVLPKLGGLFGGDLHVGMCDGSVMAVKKDFDAKEMKNLIMPADGNVIDLDKLKK